MQLMKKINIAFISLGLCVICIHGAKLGDKSPHESLRTRRQSTPVPSYLLLYSFQNNVITILRYNLDGTGFYLVRDQTISVPAPPTNQVLSIDFSLSTSSVYFSLGTRIGAASLHEPDQTASSLSIINPGTLDAVGALCFDWIRDRVYFVGTAGGIRGIYSYDVSSMITTLLQTFANPSTSPQICTAANDSLIFWSEGNIVLFGSPEIRNFVVFEDIDSAQFGDILGLFCDSSIKRLSVYLSGGSIMQYDYTMPDPRLPIVVNTLVDEGRLVDLILFPDNAMHFSIFNDAIFFLLFSVGNGFILRSTRNNNDIVTYQVLPETDSFALVQPALQPEASLFVLPCGSEPCCANNGGCSQVCVQFSLDSYYCTCGPGFTLTSSTACTLQSNTVSLVYSYYEQLSANIKLGVVRRRSIDAQSSEQSLVNAQYGGQQTERIEQLAISIANNELYILERTTPPTLSRISLFNPSIKQTILNLGLMLIANLRYDWISNYLYWTTGASILRMKPTDSTFETFLVGSSIIALALNPLNQLICYSVFSSPYDVVCVNSTKAEIFRISVGYPVISLAVDLLEDRIYWGGRMQGFFQSCSINNISDCFTVPYPALPGADDTNNSTSFIHIAGNRIVWLPTNSETIIQMNKMNGGDVVPFSVSSPGSTILSVDALDVSVSFYRPGLGYLSCLMDNGGCSHFCIPSSDGSSFSCGCADGFMLTNNVVCTFIAPQTTTPPPVTATATPCDSQFCENGGTCMTSITLGRTCSCIPPFIGAQCETFGVGLVSTNDEQPKTGTIIGVVVAAGAVLLILAVISGIILLFIIRVRSTPSLTANEVKGEKDQDDNYVNTSFEVQKDKTVA